MVHVTGPYLVPNVEVRSAFAYTNNPMCGAFRGFGVPQAAVCHEGQMDALAKQLGLDPFEIRLRNALRPGDSIATGHQLDSGVGMVDTLEQAREKSKEIFGDREGIA